MKNSQFIVKNQKYTLICFDKLMNLIIYSNIERFHINNYISAISLYMEKRKSKIDTGLTSKQTDPRPLKDKEFQSKSLKSLIKFLIKRNCPFPISLSVCLQGDMETFKEIVDYLLKQIDNSLEFESEKDLVDLLKSLNYPYPIHSQYFSGASNYWPYLIGIIDWLVKLVNIFELNSEPDIYTDYFLQAYEKFMKDQPYNELRFKFESKLSEHCTDLENQIESIWAEMKETRKNKKELKVNKVPEYENKVLTVKEELEAEQMVNEEILNDLKLFEANFDDFHKNILAILPGGIPTVAQVLEKIENDEKCNREVHRMMIELEEIRLETPELKELASEHQESEKNTEDLQENEILQEEIDDCRREYSYIMEELEQIEEQIESSTHFLSISLSQSSSQQSSSVSSLKTNLTSILQHTHRLKSLFLSSP